MSKVAKRGPLPQDPEAAALEEQRRAEQKNNPELQRGIAFARSQFLDNQQRQLQEEFANLARIKRGHGSPQAAHDNYQRCYSRIERIAQCLADAGYATQVPIFDPPPLPGAVPMRTVTPRSAAEQHAAGMYNEHGPRPTGIQPNFADTESAAHQSWINLQNIQGEQK